MISIITIVILSTYVLIGILAYRFLLSRSSFLHGMKNRPRILGALVLVVMVLIPTWDVILGNMRLKYLCANHGGLIIFAHADNVSGYYTNENPSGCFRVCQSLIASGTWKFLEVAVSKPDPRGFTHKKGYHRFSLKKKGSATCKWSEILYEKYPSLRPEIPDGYCIGSEIVEKLSSRYQYVVHWYSEQSILGEYQKEQKEILEISTGKLLARSVNYGYRGGWLKRLIATQLITRSSTCGNRESLSGMIPRILRPSAVEK